MPINASHEYFTAEKVYLEAKTIEEKITALEELIKAAPKHKGSENLLAELKTRLKKLKAKQEKVKKTGRSSQKGIKKENFQCVLVGLPNSGKSSLLARLTNAKPKISQFPYSTAYPEVGTMDYEGVKAQIVDLPSIGSANFDVGIVNTADCILIVMESLNELEKIYPHLKKTYGSKLIVLNKSDILDDEQQRKLEATLKSKKLDAVMISAQTNQNIDQLKERIFRLMHVIRIYTKEPGKSPSKIPIVLSENSTVKDIAESIRHSFSQQIKETKITGPSSKFPNQKVGLSHVCKDLDIVEFHTR